MRRILLPAQRLASNGPRTAKKGVVCLPRKTLITSACQRLSVHDQRQNDLAIRGAKGLRFARGCEILAGAELIAGHVVLAVPARDGREAGCFADHDIGIAIVAQGGQAFDGHMRWKRREATGPGQQPRIAAGGHWELTTSNQEPAMNPKTTNPLTGKAPSPPRQGGREAGRQGGREAGRQGGREAGRQGGRKVYTVGKRGSLLIDR